MRAKSTSNNQFIKKTIKSDKNSDGLIIIHIGFCIYGFSRGYRSKNVDGYDYETKKLLY